MTIVSGIFNSVNGDRKYNAKWFARYFSLFIGNGVFPNPSSGLQVTAGSNMQTVVKAGDGWINGYFIVNDSDHVLQHDVADGVLKRIDRVVMRLDYLKRKIDIVVKKGASNSTPVAPSLQRDTDAYELALADVLINNGATQISQANITDNRLNKSLCGIVHGTVDQVDTTTLFDQYQSWLTQQKDQYENDFLGWKTQKEQDFDTWQAAEKADFDSWFATIQDILDGDVAANLQNQIMQLDNKITAVDNKVTANKQEVTTHKGDGTAHGIGNKAILLTTNKTTIVGAVNELFTNVSDGKELIGGAITDVDDKVVVPTNPTFPQLADAISQINTGYGVGDIVNNLSFEELLTSSVVATSPSYKPLYGIFDKDDNYIYTHEAGYAKIDSSGNFVWTNNDNSYNYYSAGMLNSEDGGFYAVDTSGVLTKFDSSGQKVWSTSESISSSLVFDVTMDSGGNIYVANNGSYPLVKFSPDGTVIWKISAGIRYVSGIFVKEDHIYLFDSYDYRIYKYKLDGALVWNRATTFITSSKIAVDSDDNIFICGSRSTGESLQKQSQTGTIQWTKKLDYVDNIDTPVNELLPHPTGGFIISFNNGFVYRVTKDGSFSFTTEGDSYYDVAKNVSFNSAGVMYVSGGNGIRKIKQEIKIVKGV